MVTLTRIEGPMLLSSLDRSGNDLQFYGSGVYTNANTLVYLNFSQFQMGVNTSVTSEVITANGNIIVQGPGGAIKLDSGNNTIYSTGINTSYTLLSNGTGNVIIVGANIQSGNIDGTQIGTVKPTRAYFTTANTTGKANFNTANIANLTSNRIPFTKSDNSQLIDDPGMQYFTGNSTLVVTQFSTAQQASFPGLSVGNLKLTYAGTDTAFPNAVTYIASNLQIVANTGIQFFAGNSLFQTGNIRLTRTNKNQVLWSDGQGNIATYANLAYDGTTLNSQNYNIFGNISIQGNTIQGTDSNRNIKLQPGAGGSVDIGFNKIIGVVTTNTDSGDTVATKAYVDSKTGGSTIVNDRIASPGSGAQFTSVISTYNNETDTSVTVTVGNVVQANYTQGFSNTQNFIIHQSSISTTVGDMLLAPFNNARLRIQSNSAVTIPTGSTAQRPGVAIPGDFRLNTDLDAPEWYDGATWNSTVPTVGTQTIIPDGVSNQFTLRTAATTTTVLVMLNGVVQNPQYAYSVSGTQLSFTEVPKFYDTIEVRYLALSITYASSPLFVNSTYTPFDATSFATVDNWYITQYRSAQYTYSFKNPVNGLVGMGDIHMIHDNVDVYLNVREYSNNAPSYLNWYAYIDNASGTVYLQVKGNQTGNYVKLRATYFNDA